MFWIEVMRRAKPGRYSLILQDLEQETLSRKGLTGIYSPWVVGWGPMPLCNDEPVLA